MSRIYAAPGAARTSGRGLGLARLRPLPPADLRELCLHGGALHVATPRGPLPVYRFVPLQAAVLCGERVPYAAQWPEHLKLFVYSYVPLPAPLPVKASVTALVGAQARDLYGLRTWDQVTYQGWPLYLYAYDHPGRPPGGVAAHLFEPVLATQAPLPPPGAERHGP
ncbi:hypothetical protein GO986_09435 [Deinococcus sp. HMF7620]|uniref:Uncharacterized protein n=1 Tax=Deinococcus arboris TaxID=2682977 RepID=A0A7C9HRT8_9DEIO|nr:MULTISPECIES: hypothetical protein [Deinococcus]MBZ9750848.1 hypothetical protein [Deinococcus betulae]MVN86987.1 hypothetical protein [Deinococcus arboris]